VTYEKGSYLKELEAAHRSGEHDESKDLNCSACSLRDEDDLFGFETPEERNRATYEAAIELEDTLAEHARGEHRDHPGASCVHQECLDRE
jgi:hypothetical protein